ncbi:MAG: phosphotransferase family protein [Polyangiales bacterium]
MTDFLDRPSAVRAGQDFDVAALERHLVGVVPGLRGPLIVEQFGRGYSNLTYLVKGRDARGGERELVLRRPPPGVHIKSAHDMGREVKILSALADHWSKAPRPVLHCEDPAVIGTPFYLMERVAGVVLRAKTPPGLDLSPGRMATISTAMIDTLAEIHTLDWRAIGLGDLGKPDGYAARQVAGWADRYRKAQTEEVPSMDALEAWLRAHVPASGGAALIHNDFKYDNCVLAPDLSAVRAVLDGEMATIGDPLMDLGTALGYWIQADDPPVFQVMVFGPTHLPGNLTRVELVHRWAERTGRDPSNVLFCYASALFKLAVVAQQLYKRWKDGVTREERYAVMGEGVRAVSAAALHAIDKGRIDRLAEP